jgi:hypothetical protein
MRASVNALSVWTACLEATEAYPEQMETNPEEIKSVTEYEEFSKEEAAGKSFGALKKRHRRRRLVSGRRGKPKERT